MSFAIARQPVFDREGNVFAYEVYLRESGNLYVYPTRVPYNKATFIVTEIIAELGVSKVSDGKRILMNVSLDSILNKVLDLLPLDALVFGIIPPQTEVGEALLPSILKRMEELKEKGALFSLSEKLYTSKYIDLLHRSHIVEFSIWGITEEKATAIKRGGRKLLITKIESEEDYRKAKAIGDLFEGNYLGRPAVVKEFEIAPFLKSTLMRMIGALNTAGSVRDFAKIIGSDAGMSAKLLRFVNSSYFTKRKEIKDIVQACAYLGMENLQKFTLLVATNDYVSVEDPYLWKRSLVRAIIAEELARRRDPRLAGLAYIAGLFSLIDRILGVDKVLFLKEVNIDKEVIEAYTGENEELSSILQDVYLLEEALDIGSDRLDAIVEEVAVRSGTDPSSLKGVLLEAQVKAEEILNI